MKSALLRLAVLGTLLIASAARADEPPFSVQELAPPTLAERASSTVQGALDQALGLIGIRYRRGGASPETGFDCSGFVSHVFRESLGLELPHNALAISRNGEAVPKAELQPGDLVFFNTVRKAFSHVGIYLGDHLFVHAPRRGGKVRVEDMREGYWAKRFNGARRIASN